MTAKNAQYAKWEEGIKRKDAKTAKAREGKLVAEFGVRRRSCGVRILYVENHAVFAETVTRQFLSEHSVVVVPSITGAQDALRASTFDLLLIDYDLDDGKGDELVRRVADGKIRIIGVSSHQAGNDALLKAGAQAVCGKMEFDEIQCFLKRGLLEL